MPAATVNGVNLSYAAGGEGPPFVLMHGFMTGKFVWDPLMEGLPGRFQIVRYDHRGHGDSDKPPGPYRIQDFADDLLGLLNYLGLEKVDLMGHSMGGRTALLFALQHPGRLNRLFLVGASGGVACRPRPRRDNADDPPGERAGDAQGTYGDHGATCSATVPWRDGPGLVYRTPPGVALRPPRSASRPARRA